MIERKGIIEFKGKDVSVVGLDLREGNVAEDFIATDQNWNDISVLEFTKGNVRIIASVPSLDTSVCDRETRQFNQEASALSSEISIIVISMDLPFAQNRWCGAAGVDRVLVFSDHKSADFGIKYSVLLKEPRLLRRAVFIVDRENIIRYVAYMPTLKDEPNYGEVLAFARGILSGSNN